MRPSHALAGVGRLREITVWKAVVFGILTLGIYLLVVEYGHTKETQEAREHGFDLWLLLFVLGIFLPFVHLVNYWFNHQGFQEFRAAKGLPETQTGLVAFILAVLPVLGLVGAIVWANHVNASLRAMAAQA